LAPTQIGGVIKDKNGNTMKADSDIDEPTGTFGGNSSSGGPSIKSIKVTDDDSEGYIAVGDTIEITFSEKIDPKSIN